MKANKKSCLVVIVALFFLTVNTLGQEKIYTVDLSRKEQEVVKMHLSTIAADVNYIALETRPDSYITRIFKLVKTNDNFLVLDQTAMKRERLIIFKLNGSFIALINRVGKGPGEYSAIEDFAFDPETQIITILDSGQKKFLQFTLSGQYIREVKMDVRPMNMCYIDPGYFVVAIPLITVKPADDGKLFNIIIYDRDLKVKKRIATSDKSLESPDSPYLITGGMTSFENQLRYKQPFVNDFDGSMAFWPDLSSGSDELIRSFNAIEFRETCDKNHVKGYKSKFPGQQKKLLDVLGKLDENSNPVIQVVTLKKS